MHEWPVVYLILTHHLPDLTHRLVRVLLDESPRSFVVVHHDFSKGELPPFASPRVHVLDDHVVTTRGDMSPVRATLRGVGWIRAHLDYGWIVLLSGQDYPIVPLARVEAELVGSPYEAYIRVHTTDEAARLIRERYLRRWYSARVPLRRRGPVTITVPYNCMFRNGFACHKASQWWMLSRRAVEHLSRFLDDEPRYWRQYERSFIPDESFIQTAVLNGPAHVCRDNRRFIRWSTPGARHPDLLTVRDVDQITTSPHWFARKFHPGVCAEVLDRLDAHRHGLDAGAERRV